MVSQLCSGALFVVSVRRQGTPCFGITHCNPTMGRLNHWDDQRVGCPGNLARQAEVFGEEAGYYSHLDDMDVSLAKTRRRKGY